MGPALLCLHLPIQYLKWNVWQNQDKPRRSTLRILFSQQEWKDHLPVFQGPHTHRESLKGVLILPTRPLGTGDGLGRSPHRTGPHLLQPARLGVRVLWRCGLQLPQSPHGPSPTTPPRLVERFQHTTDRTCDPQFSRRNTPELARAGPRSVSSTVEGPLRVTPPGCAAHPQPPGAGSGGLCWTRGLRGPEARSRTCAATVPRWRPQPRARVRPRALTADPERG